jgi:hypothetical protein
MLTACHGRSSPAAAEPAAQSQAPLTDAPVTASASAKAAQVQPVTQVPQAPTSRQATSQELAQTLAAEKTFAYSGIPFGFEPVGTPMSCQPTGQIAYTCGFQYTDQTHGGGSADLKLLIFDDPVNFEDFRANLKSSTDEEAGAVKAFYSGAIQTTRNGVNTLLPGDCRQSVGQTNGLARCAFLIDPRVVLLTILRPEKPSHDESDPADADLDRAKSLAITSFSILQASNFSSTVVAETAPVAAAAPADPVFGRTPPKLMKRIEEILGSNSADDAK